MLHSDGIDNGINILELFLYDLSNQYSKVGIVILFYFAIAGIRPTNIAFLQQQDY